MRNHRGMAADLIAGAVAGALATWVMGKVTTALYSRESAAARQREDDARDGKTAYGVAADKTAALAGRHLSDEERQVYGQGIHWALGIGAGAAYGALRARFPRSATAGGLTFGVAFWLLMDEMVTPVLGLTPGPTAFPWETHARGLAGHLAFGAVADTALRALQPA